MVLSTRDVGTNAPESRTLVHSRGIMDGRMDQLAYVCAGSEKGMVGVVVGIGPNEVTLSVEGRNTEAVLRPKDIVSR